MAETRVFKPIGSVQRVVVSILAGLLFMGISVYSCRSRITASV